MTEKMIFGRLKKIKWVFSWSAPLPWMYRRTFKCYRPIWCTFLITCNPKIMKLFCPITHSFLIFI